VISGIWILMVAVPTRDRNALKERNRYRKPAPGLCQT
jgi:hypothetical protein